ncbi:hypothetical protein [Paraburkholderia bannensis]|uniref:hypothetical protein n=1 Tax=Paraburkholderia bannensis TaxID=765414 RepID=UPI002AB77E23|nr:hypothetical protein [Paraburkholderia bannensis]
MAGLFDPTDPTAGGLMSGFAPSQGMPGVMGMLANPQTAGLLGMAGGLLQASGPSRLPVTNGIALGSGLQGMQQGIGNAMQNQRAMLTMQAMQGLMGNPAASQSAPSQQSGAPAGAPVSGTANTGPMSGPSAGMGLYAGAGSPLVNSADAAQSTGTSIFGRTPQQLWNQGMLMNMAGIPGGADMMKMAAQYDPTLQAQMPTDITKMGVQGGMTPQQIQAANLAGVNKANYIAPVNARPGSILRDPLTMQPMAFNPNIPAGGTPVFDASGNVVGISSIPGAAGVTSAMAAAKTAGEGSMLPYSGFDAQGNPLPVTNRTAAATQGSIGTAPTLSGIFAQQESSGGKTAPDNPFQIQQGTFNQYAQPSESWSNPADRSAVAQRVLAGYSQKYGGDLGRVATAYFSGEGNVAPAGSPTPFIKNTADSNGKTVASYVGDILGRAGGAGFGGSPSAGGGQIYASQPMGASTFAQGQVQQMQSRWNALRDQNASAQTVISQLQNISSLAPSAITGAEADKRAYVNGLLSLVGVPGAQDAKTATDLLDKYSNQIIAKLGQGGLGTDAARSIVSAGNPNAHMTVPAIQEAVRNLSGQYQMTQAKASLLQQYANGNDPSGYNKAETTFDRNADPRIWEYQSIQDPAARQQFAAGVLKQDPKFGQKIQALEQIGALQ